MCTEAKAVGRTTCLYKNFGQALVTRHPAHGKSLPLSLQSGHSRNVLTFDIVSIRSYSITFCGFGFACFLDIWRRQQAGDALVQIEQEGDAFGVGGVGLFAAAGLVGGVYGGV